MVYYDAELQSVITAVKTNKWEKSYVSSTLDTLSRFKYELTVVPVNHGEILLHDKSSYQIRVITKLPNSEQSYKGKVKTHNYINRQNQSTTGKL
jgi:hypothetical protein